MPATTVDETPSLAEFLKSIKQTDIDSSIDFLVYLLERRQIRNSRQCAIATAQLLLRVVSGDNIQDAQALIKRIREVGRRLVAAQPREMAVGNIVRRVLGVVREIADDDHDSAAGSAAGDALSLKLPDMTSSQSSLSGPVPSSHTTMQTQANSLFGLFQHPQGITPTGTPPVASSPVTKGMKKVHENEKLDIQAEVIDGIKELLDELEVVDSQIAESALDHIHSNEIILTHTSSHTVQKFLMTAARKRKFTVIHAESYPNNHESTHSTIVNGSRKTAVDADEADSDERWRPLTSMGITVILIPDTAAFALMPRINKVVLAPHTVLANGSLIAAAGASIIARAAKVHHVPVVVLSGVYKLSPVYPFDTEGLVESGDPVMGLGPGGDDFNENVEVANPLSDWVDAELVDLYITNLGGHAPSYLYRIVADHYRAEDIDLGSDD